MTHEYPDVVRFHGHSCGGLATGFRVAQAALREIGAHAEDEEVVCLTETDNCAVDAVQVLTGCTFGKGNLIHLDYGKNAFTFIRRSDGTAIRILVQPRKQESHADLLALAQRAEDPALSDSDRQELREQLDAARIQTILTMPEEQLLDIRLAQPAIPAPARIHGSVTCAGCSESVMETRARLFRGKTYCLPCFQERDHR
jgi:formylmethanofuran dehydrogenase subunit E